MTPVTTEQLKAYKAQMQAQKRTQNTPKAQSKATTPPTVKTAKNAKGKGFLVLPQISRDFDLMNASIENCKQNYPNDYHHKFALKVECESLATMLAGGGELLSQLVQLVGYQTLNDNQKALLKHFNAAKNYLVGNLRTTANHVQAVEDGTAKKCYSARFVKGEVKHDYK